MVQLASEFPVGRYHCDWRGQGHLATDVQVADLATAVLAHRHLAVQHEACERLPNLALHLVVGQVLEGLAGAFGPIGLLELAASEARHRAAGVLVLVAVCATGLELERLQHSEVGALELELVEAPVRQVAGDFRARRPPRAAGRGRGSDEGGAANLVLVRVPCVAASLRLERQGPDRRISGAGHAPMRGQLGDVCTSAPRARPMELLIRGPMGELRSEHWEVVQAVQLFPFLRLALDQSTLVRQAHRLWSLARLPSPHRILVVGAALSGARLIAQRQTLVPAFL
mmetsp:Transcript_48570/g.135069  ORF Transcript_48570/g.135069 Transcript_48570/m.135069 type:complete len:284 (+) Transcript_48570:2782-3633(+)